MGVTFAGGRQNRCATDAYVPFRIHAIGVRPSTLALFFHFSLNSLHFTSHRLNSILDNALSSRSSYNYTNRPHPTRTPLRLWHLIRTMYTCYIPQLQTGSWVTYIRTSLELDVQHVLCRVVVSTIQILSGYLTHPSTGMYVNALRHHRHGEISSIQTSTIILCPATKLIKVFNLL